NINVLQTPLERGLNLLLFGFSGPELHDNMRHCSLLQFLQLNVTSLPSKRVLTEPFVVPLRAVEARAGFVELVLAFQGGGPGALQKAGDLGLRERLEGADGFDGL